MKKFYFFIIAAMAFAMNASAWELQPNVAMKVDAPKGQTVKLQKAHTQVAKAPAANMEELLGAYEIYGVERVTSDGSAYETLVPVELTAGENANEVLITGTSSQSVYSAFSIVATVDFAAAKFTIQPQDLGTVPVSATESHDLKLEHARWVYEGKDASGQEIWNIQEGLTTAIEGQIVDGGIAFDEDDLMMIAAWQNGSKKGYYSGMDYLAFVEYVEPEDPFAPYVALEGKATFIDGWVLSMVGIVGETANEYAVEVAVEQSTVNPQVYRLVAPFQTGVFTEINESEIDGEIVINCSDPECVLIEPYHAGGFSATDYGIDQMYCLNLESYVYYSEGEDHLSIEDIKTQFPQASLNVSNRKGNTVTLYNLGFGLGSAKFELYSWVDENKNPIEMTAIIELPESAGIGDIVADDVDAPVEFFNLQGVKVENPESGLYIRRQGSTATKVVIR